MNSDDCRHSDDFVLFGASFYSSISLQLMDFLVVLHAFRVNTARGTLQVLGLRMCVSTCLQGPRERQLDTGILWLLTAPADPALINKPAN